jgi:hypothetical protein
LKEPEDGAPDAEVLAWASKMTTSALQRAAVAKLSGKPFDECMAAAAEGMPTTMLLRLFEHELREIGCVNTVPRPFWHWVYRYKDKPGRVVMLSWNKRLLLQQRGYIDIEAFTNEGMQ